jgi:hypothetical protein
VPEATRSRTTSDAWPTSKVPFAPEAAGQRCHSARHVSAGDKLQIKYLYTVNDCNNPVAMYSVWDLGSYGMFGQYLPTYQPPYK